MVSSSSEESEEDDDDSRSPSGRHSKQSSLTKSTTASSSSSSGNNEKEQMRSKKELSSAIQDIISSDLWPTIKFVVKENTWAYSETIPQFIMQEIGITRTREKKEWWERNSKTVKEKFNRKRNNVCGKIREQLDSKLQKLL
jgi:hypothetical protein